MSNFKSLRFETAERFRFAIWASKAHHHPSCIVIISLCASSMHRAWNVALDADGVLRKVAGNLALANCWDAGGLLMVSDPHNFEASATQSSESIFFGIAPAVATLPPENMEPTTIVSSFLIANAGARLIFSGSGEMYYAAKGQKHVISTGLGQLGMKSLTVRCEEGSVTFACGERIFKAPAVPVGEYYPCVFMCQLNSTVLVRS